jgi:AraC-like DNA-binding protein
MVQVFIYNILAIIKIEKYTRCQTIISKQKTERLRWNKFIIYGYFIACMVFNMFSVLRDFYIDFEQYKLISLIIFTAYFTAILYRSLSSSHFSLPIEKERTATLHEIEIDELKNKLINLMNQQKLFLEPELSLSQLSEKLQIKDKQLSELINNHYQKNFSEFINEFRLEEAKQLLTSPKNAKKTILEIIYASGFNSKSVFNLAFKNNTGLTPTQFRKSAKTL